MRKILQMRVKLESVKEIEKHLYQYLYQYGAVNPLIGENVSEVELIGIFWT